MVISLITVCYNSGNTITKTLQSVKDQTYLNIEYIVIDGNSKDNTLELVNGFPNISKVISEPDKGMYDALNKGIKLASGDYIGILNADDVLHTQNTVKELTDEIKKDELDLYYGDIRFIHPDNLNKTIRYYSAKNWNPSKFKWGYMPPHPSVYIKKEIFEIYGDYKLDYKISADYELLVRFIHRYNVSCRYIPQLMVDMMPGGISNKSVYSRYLLNKEIVKACADNGIQTNLFMLALKYFSKMFEYLP
ncbi:MAG TPA: glycosyltransferase family 2 protein [Cyclobacteriaceae bacterium]